MKELSVEEKAKRYDEALIRGSKLWESDMITRENYEYIFPEVKESENIKIIKAIKYGLDHVFTNNTTVFEVTKEQCFAWLEKQGEQKCNEEYNITGIKSKNAEGKLGKMIKNLKHADKIESKFRKGDWVVYCNDDVDLITGIEEKGYCINNGGYIPFICESDVRLWTIQDAKDGDVLNSTRVQATIIFKGFAEDGKHINAYCALQSGIFIHQEILWDRDFEPASKNWKNALFGVMKEAGYEWDADKKELKKIVAPIFHIGDRVKYKGHSCDGVITEITDTDYICGDAKLPISTQDKLELVEQNPNWSEDDEQYLLVCKNALAKYQTTDKWDANIVSNWLENKLKSLRPQNGYNPYKEVVESIAEMCKHYDKASHSGLRDFYDNVKVKCKDAKEYDSLYPQTTWKPSDEQMEALEKECIAHSNYELCRLLEQLKKLKG